MVLQRIEGIPADETTRTEVLAVRASIVVIIIIDARITETISICIRWATESITRVGVTGDLIEICKTVSIVIGVTGIAETVAVKVSAIIVRREAACVTVIAAVADHLTTDQLAVETAESV